VHSLDAGAQFSARGIVAPTKVDGDSVNDRVTEFFARDAFTVADVLFSAGARTTSSTLWGNTFSPSVGAAWQASPQWRLRTNVARGFRAPTFKELRYTFINGGAGYQIVGNSELRPESSWSSSIGASWAPSSGVALDVEGYRNAVAHLISTQQTGANNAGLLVYQNVNVDRARTEGVETSVRVMRRGAELSVGYDYLNAIDLSTGKTLDGRAKHTARIAWSKDWPRLGGVISDVSTRYIGSAPRGATTQGALVSVDGQLRVGVSRGMELSLAVANLLDQRPSGYTPAYQRQFSIGLRAKWAARQ
jgi:outer membrane receptor for ferrienterochelin and colicins